MLEKVGPFKAGDPVRSSWLQQMLLALKMLTNIRGVYPIRVSFTPGGVLISSDAAVDAATTPYRITAVSGSFPTWTYTLQKVTKINVTLSSYLQFVTDGTNVSAVNRCEFANPTTNSTYTYGTGNLITSSSGQVNSTSCVVVSIGVGSVVDVRSLPNNATSGAKTTLSFYAANSAQ